MFRKMPPISDLVSYISVSNWPLLIYNPSQTDFDHWWSVDQSVKDQLSCYTYTYRGSRFLQKMVLNNPYMSYLFSIAFRTDRPYNKHRNVTIYLHNRNMINSGQDNAFRKIERRHGIAHLTYDLYRSELLEWPYPTKCRDYAKISKFRSKSHCIDDCRLRNYVENFSFIPNEVIIQMNSSYPNMRFDLPSDYENKTIKEKAISIETNCLHICSNEDCVREEFIPYIRKNEQGQNFTISLEPPRGLDFTVKFEAAINLIDFVTYVLSTIGFWTGFAPITLTGIKSPKRSRSKSQLFEMIRTIQIANDLEKQYMRQQIKEILKRIKVL